MNQNSNFNFDPELSVRFIQDHAKLGEIVQACRMLGKRIVLTSGTFDLVHIGHARYLKRGKKLGEVLIVGVDDDKKVRERKGLHRPIVPQEERVEFLLHLPYVDYVFLKRLQHQHWALIKTVRPDVLLATKETYTKTELRKLKRHCRKVVVLEPQATATTSARIRDMLIRPVQELLEHLEETKERMNQDLTNVQKIVRNITRR